MKENVRHIHLTLLIAAALTVLLFSCVRPENAAYGALAAQRKQWLAEMWKTFPEGTQDTVELRRRLEHFNGTGNKIGRLTMYRVLGIQARYGSRFQTAIEHHTAGLQIAREIFDTVNITILLNDLATDYRRIGAYNDAAPYSYLALETGEQYRGPDSLPIQRNMASAYNGLGNIYLPMEQYDEALEVFEKALELEIPQNNHWGIAVNLSNIGSIYFSRGDYARAEDYYRQSMKSNELANQLVGTALGRINIGEVYEAQGRLGEALHEYGQAYSALKGSTDDLHWIDACYHIADIHIRQGRTALAVSFLDEGLLKAREINSMKHLQRGHDLRADFHYRRGDFRSAVDDMHVMRAYADTVQQNRESDRLMESRLQYEANRYSRRIEELDRAHTEQKARSRTMRMLTFPLLAVLSVVVLMLVWKRRLERRQAEAMKSLDRMRSNFFTNITHELRTPITVINGLSNHLLSEPDDPGSPQFKDLDAIRRQGEQLLHLVNQLLDFSRSEAGVDKPRRRCGDIVEYLRVVAEPYVQYARSRGIELIVYSEAESLTMNFAPSHLGRVMANLLSNALKHCREGDRIAVHFRHDAATRKCRIQVKDSGEGIAPETLAHIFELYYTTASGNAGHTGSGIGLALSKRLIEETDGTITVESAPGKGTEFVIILPVSDAPIPPDELDRTEAPVVAPVSDIIMDGGTEEFASEAAGEERKTILIVEDNRDVAHYISTILDGKYSLLYAKDGSEGLRMAEQHIPDLIITDVMMPVKDGYAFTADLRASLPVQHIPVIMLTAKGETDDRLEGLKAGADAYLSKPFDERELTVRIKQLLDSRAMLMTTYSNALLDGGAKNGADTDHNMTFIGRLSIMVSSRLDDEAYFPDGLAADMCLSHSQLNRKMKAMTGYTIFSFVMRMRLDKARQMLLKRDKSIAEIAYTCGFNDPAYFTRSFKEVFGYTPSQYIKNLERQNAKK
jgi:signal transduction histidine kinase/CheY-like chemotaxis protein